MQRIVVFQQGGRAEPKVRWIREQGRGIEIVRVVSIDPDLPEVVDDPERHLPADLEADLVLDYLRHPDLTHALALRCRELGVPMVASGRRVRIEGLHIPPTCCGLPHDDRLGAYGLQFGAPELRVTSEGDRVARVEVDRGSPCGSTWSAAQKVEGLNREEAAARFGLEVQLLCQADPAAWDPIHGKSPLHFAGKVHARAFQKALDHGDRMKI